MVKITLCETSSAMIDGLYGEVRRSAKRWLISFTVMPSSDARRFFKVSAAFDDFGKSSRAIPTARAVRFFTRTRPLSSRMRPRGASTATMRTRLCSAAFAYVLPDRT